MGDIKELKKHHSLAFAYANKENGDHSFHIYCGCSAGKDIKWEIKKAKEEVIVVSPYVKTDMLNTLCDLSEKGVKTRLFFSKPNKQAINAMSSFEKIKDEEKTKENHKKNHDKEKQRYAKAKEQHKSLNYKLVKQQKLENLSTISIFMMFTITLFSFSIINNILVNAVSLLLLVISVGLNLFTRINMHKINKSLSAIDTSYNYIEETEEYITKLNKIVDYNYIPEKEGLMPFIHAKIYIIDSKILFTGSTNYTENGFKNSIESRVKIMDKDVVQKFRKELVKALEERVEIYGKELTVEELTS